MNLFGTDSFDTTSSLALMYLWMFFAFFAVLLSCDLRRIASQNKYIQHLLAFFAMFFLITVIDANNNMGVFTTWLKTIVLYVLFMMSTKSKWPFIAALIFALMVDLTIKIHIDFKKKKDEETQTPQEIRNYMRILIFAIIIIGFIHYTFRAIKDHKKNFSWEKYLLGTGKCSR